MELTDFTVPEDNDSVEETKTGQQIEQQIEQQDAQESVEEVAKPKRTRRRRKTQTTSRAMKTKTCKVLRYNEKAKILDIDFDGYGIRIKGVKDVTSDEVVVKYKGEIGKPDFQCKLG